MESKQCLQKHQHDRHSQERKFPVGQRVMVRNYRQGQDWIPATVTQELGSRTFLVCVENGQIWKRHSNQMKIFGSSKGLTEIRSEENPETGTFDSTELPISRPPTLPPAVPASPTPVPDSLPPPPVTTPRYPHRSHRPPDRFESIP